MDNTALFIIAVLAVILIIAGLILKRVSAARLAAERARMQRLAYQPASKPVPITPTVPVLRPDVKQRPVAAPPPEIILENCRDFPQSLHMLADKYYLGSFTIATSDGLVLATSGSSTAQEDAALYSGKNNGNTPPDMTLFSLSHKGSDLIGIIRSQENITVETKKCIERDIQGILTKWI